MHTHEHLTHSSFLNCKTKNMAGLVRHVDPDELLKNLHEEPFHKALRGSNRTNTAVSYGTPYNSRYAATEEIPKFRLPDHGAPADVVHQLIKNELDLDGVSDEDCLRNYC